MSGDVLVKLQSELAVLRVKRDGIDAAIEEIEGAMKVIEKYAPSGPLGAPSAAAFSTSNRQPPKQQQIVDGAAAILSDGKARHTHDLLVELTEMGVAVGGIDPKGNLSAYLSREKDIFENDRRNGWSLKNKTPEGVAAPTGVEDLL